MQFLCLDPHRLSVASRCPAPFSTVPCAQVGGLGAAGEATRARVWSAAPSCSAEVALRPLGDAGRRNRPRRRFSDCGPSVRQHVTAYENVFVNFFVKPPIFLFYTQAFLALFIYNHARLMDSFKKLYCFSHCFITAIFNFLF